MGAFDAVFTTEQSLTIGRLNNPTGRVVGGAASQRIAFSGVLFAANGSLGCTGSSETTVYSRTVKADACDVDGDRLELDLWGAWAANANTKTVRFKFGSFGTYYTLGAQNINGGYWHARIMLTRLSSSTARTMIQVTTNTQSSGVITVVAEGSLTGLDFAADQTLWTTLQGGATSDVIARDYIVWWHPGTAEVT